MIDYNINKKEIKQIYNYVKNNYLLFNEDCIKYLNRIIKDEEKLFCSSAILKDIINTTLLCHANMYHTDYLFIAKKLYKLNVSLMASEDEVKNFFNIYKLVLDLDCYRLIEATSINIDDFIKKINFIYNLFENKNLVKIIFSKVEWLSSKQEDQIKLFSHLQKYLSKSRMYYSDELVYVSSINNFLEKIKPYINNTDNINGLIDRQLSFDKKINSIYDIDDEKIKELESKIVELKNKLKSIEENTNKNTAAYKKIDEEAQKLLNDISKYHIKDSKRVFKVMQLSEDAERKILLRMVKRYNCNFKICTADSNWFCKNVIDKLGIEYVANSNSNTQASINTAYKNNQIEKLKQILELNPDFCLRYPILIQEIIDFFCIDTIANNINGTKIQQLLLNLYKKNELSVLKQILDINPNFNIYSDDILDFINKNLIGELPIQYIANSKKVQQKTIYYFASQNEVSKLSSILEINPNFYISDNIDKYTTAWYLKPFKIDSISSLITNFDIQNIIDFFDLEALNLYKMYKLCNSFGVTDVNFNIDKEITKFTSLDDIDRQNFLNIDFEHLSYRDIIKKYNKILKNSANKTKKLVKK